VCMHLENANVPTAERIFSGRGELGITRSYRRYLSINSATIFSRALLWPSMASLAEENAFQPNVGDALDLSERKVVGFDSRLRKIDLERSVGDAILLANQLITPLTDERPVALGVRVYSV